MITFLCGAGDVQFLGLGLNAHKRPVKFFTDVLRASFPASPIERRAAFSVSVQRRVLYGARCVVI
jgi:hypothetical protein